MQTQVQERGADCLVSVSGRITIDSSPELLSLLLPNLSAAGRDSLTVDLWDVVYIDTSALAVLLETLRAARKLKRTFHLSGLRGRPRYLMEVTGFIRLFSEVPNGISA
jgi:anti-sigma B factor antagonist